MIIAIKIKKFISSVRTMGLVVVVTLLLSACSSSHSTSASLPSYGSSSSSQSSSNLSGSNSYKIDISKLGSLTNYSAVQYADGKVFAYYRVYSTSNWEAFSSLNATEPEFIVYNNTQYAHVPTVGPSGQVTFTWQPNGHSSYDASNPYYNVVQSFINYVKNQATDQKLVKAGSCQQAGQQGTLWKTVSTIPGGPTVHELTCVSNSTGELLSFLMGGLSGSYPTSGTTASEAFIILSANNINPIPLSGS